MWTGSDRHFRPPSESQISEVASASAVATTSHSLYDPTSSNLQIETVHHQRTNSSLVSGESETGFREIIPNRAIEQDRHPLYFESACISPTAYIIQSLNERESDNRRIHQRSHLRQFRWKPYTESNVNECHSTRNLLNTGQEATDSVTSRQEKTSFRLYPKILNLQPCRPTHAHTNEELSAVHEERILRRPILTVSPSLTVCHLSSRMSNHSEQNNSSTSSLVNLSACGISSRNTNESSEHSSDSEELYEERTQRPSMFRTNSIFEKEVNEPHSTQILSTLEKSHLLSIEVANLRDFCVMKRSTPSPYARMVANRVIKHAREHKVLNEKKLWCLGCDRIPIYPVTGQCGHTRCSKCIQDSGPCPCGGSAPSALCVNIVTQELIEKMLNDSSARDIKSSLATKGFPDYYTSTSSSVLSAMKMRNGCTANSIQLHPHGSAALMSARSARFAVSPRAPMTLQVRFKYARGLIAIGQQKEAVAHLARVAAAPEPLAHTARVLLAQTIDVLSKGRDPRRLTRELNRLVRAQAAASWLRTSDLECPLCYHTYTRPVTTPCGHTYCRTCIERLLDYSKCCALCLRSLDQFDLSSTAETVFISAALESIDALTPPLPLDPNIIPILVCTVAFPAIPCPLFIFDPRYWLMIRRVLESGSRKFGMVAYEKYRTYSDYGTVLEVRDCVLLEDGRFILSTVGVSRFKVIEKDVRDGFDVARIHRLVDNIPSDDLAIWKIRNMAWLTFYKALLWLDTMNHNVRASIEAAFGELPKFFDKDENWWQSPDGPAWLWWFIAILPLKPEIKMLILSTKCLLKRLMAVSRTLEAMEHMAISTTTTMECEVRSALSNSEEWLERSE